MVSEPGGGLAAILAAWTAMLRTGGTDELAAILDPDVVWWGILPEQVCHGRDETLDILARNRPRPPRITRVEAQESGHRVAVSVEGPDFPAGGPLPADAPRSLLFTFRGGKVIEMQSLPGRDAAFALLSGWGPGRTRTAELRPPGLGWRYGRSGGAPFVGVSPGLRLRRPRNSLPTARTGSK